MTQCPTPDHCCLHGCAGTCEIKPLSATTNCSALPQIGAAPVAHLWQHSETGRTRIVMPDQIVTVDSSWLVVGPLYLGSATS